MNRRNFLKALAVTAAGIAVPEIILPEKRFWQLDKTMIEPQGFTTGWMDMGYPQLDHQGHSFIMLSGSLEDGYWEVYKEQAKNLEHALSYGAKSPYYHYLDEVGIFKK